jgi:membrane protease YdiL (CAAX protease family)
LLIEFARLNLKKMPITFIILAASICAVWLPSLQLGKRKIAPWPVLFICALGSGFIQNFIKPIAIVELGLLAMCAYLAVNSTEKRAQSIVFSIVAGIGALALAMHLLPGFNNPVLISNIKFSEDATAYTQYLNVDKAAAGLILLVFLCARISAAADWLIVLRKTYPIAIVTTTVVVLVANMIGYIRPEIKISSYTPIFLVTNLLFTCVAEEAFFRGFFQDRLSKSLSPYRYGDTIAVICSAGAFGLMHIGGGTSYIFLATLIGFGSAYAYSRVKHIEAPIITHFALNAVHFVCFTYPHLVKI